MKSKSKLKKFKPTESFANMIFTKTVTALLNKYEKFPDRDKTSFMAFCISLRDTGKKTLSNLIIDSLVSKYEESEEKQAMSFMTYCIRLRDLSNKNVGKEIHTCINPADELNQINLEEGENKNGECTQ